MQMDFKWAYCCAFFQKQTSNVDIEGIDVRQLLKEKVKLEGQLEMLDVETRQAIRDRAELQTQVLRPCSYLST